LVDSLESGQAITDTVVDGFRVRAGKTSKVYSVQKRVGNRIVTRTIGKHGVYLPEVARKQARYLLLQLAQGVDPLAERRAELQRNGLTFGKLVQLYVDERKLAATTRNDIKTKVEKHLSDWLRMPAADITRQIVLTKFNALLKTGPTQAALVARYARAIFNFGIAYYTDDRTGESLIQHNPLTALTALRKLPPPRRRDSFIDRRSLGAWFKAWEHVRCRKRTHCDYILTTLLLGCRKNETAKLKWQDVNLDEGYVLFRGTKNGTDHLMPIGPYLKQLLTERLSPEKLPSEYVFPGRVGHRHVVDARKTMTEISDRAGVPFMMSDLRRTFATHCAAIGISYLDIKRLLNHKLDNREATPGYIIVELERKKQQVTNLEEALLSLGAIQSNDIRRGESAIT
jgi:integrase